MMSDGPPLLTSEFRATEVPTRKVGIVRPNRDSHGLKTRIRVKMARSIIDWNQVEDIIMRR